MQETLQFKVSSALKDIIGKDLITDDNIAVFELVKNSFDAHATQVDIYFENIYSSNHGSIVIIDNGKGMNYKDLLNKWLFVAYSAKIEGTEDDNFDYRDKIFKDRPFAGAKGIGRFSCDRLGKRLYLETIKKEINPKIEILITEWDKFEGNIKQEFVNINVVHETAKKGLYNLEHGTVLKITELRSEWNRNKLLKLRASLAKLINPNNTDEDFKIVIHVDEELETDEQFSESFEKINGKVSNFIFEALDIKTTKIHAAISEDGNFITTTLTDGGTLIYRISENNKYKLLNSINYTIYFLNTSAKLTFTRRMGLSSNKFGHIFLYKNGFRVYPYGEPGEDSLKIDARKAGGVRRYLGTRDIIGQIEVFSTSNELKETSSRGDGLIKTPAYTELEQCFWDVMKRLEKYVVEIQFWGISVEDSESGDIKNRIAELITKLSGSSDILEFEYSEEILNKVNEAQSESASVLVDNLKKIAISSNNSNLLWEAGKISRQVKLLESINQETLNEVKAINIQYQEVREKLEIKDREVELLKEASNEEIIELLSIEHHINQATFRVDGYIKAMYELVKGDSQRENLMIDIMDNILLENKKIASLVKFIRSANFDLLSSKITQDLAIYISQYINKVYKNDRVRRINKKLVPNVYIESAKDLVAIFNFVPLEINIILDNLLDNSFKASSSIVWIKLKEIKNDLVIDYKDNGTGIALTIKPILFDFGTTTTGGSGIGLYHIKRIVQAMGGDITLNDETHGAHFTINLPKK